MNADNVNRWLTLGANIGVLVGLALLIVELDQNSDLVRAQIHQARSDNFESFYVGVADTEHLLPVLAKFAAAGGPADISALQELNPIERARLHRYWDGRIGGYDNLHYQYKQGFLDEGFYNIRVMGAIKTNLPLWQELGLVRLGAENPRVTKSFAAELERALADD
ncbi:MAG: hypothetical protein OES12_07660 [Anaerolineae bacterium]|nr:hypothetical protein [Anaerolineae bacterium]